MKPMCAAEIAEALGIKPDTFYRRRRVLEQTEGMPAPLVASAKPLRWERTGMQLWLTRHSPHAPKAPANDQAPQLAATADDRRQQLHDYYSGFNGGR